MLVEDFINELKLSLRSYDKRDLIDDASVYRWVEIALKKFGGDIAVPKETIIDVKNGNANMPGDYYDLIVAYRCDFAGYDIPDGEKVIPELQNTFAWKERTERSYRWCSCDECCKEESEKTIIEKFYINTHDVNHEVRCHYRKPEPLRLSKPMLSDKCLSKCRNKMFKDSPWEINITGGKFYANFDGPVYMKYRSLPFDDEGNIFIPDTSQGLLADYIENYVKMRLFEEWTLNNEVQGASEVLKLYIQQDLIKFKNAKTELKMDNLTWDDFYKSLNRRKNDFIKYEIMSPMIDNVIKLI